MSTPDTADVSDLTADWTQFDAYAQRTLRSFWHMGEILCRIRDKSERSFIKGLDDRGFSTATAYRWIKLHQSFTLEALDGFSSVRSALDSLIPALPELPPRRQPEPQLIEPGTLRAGHELSRSPASTKNNENHATRGTKRGAHYDGNYHEARRKAFARSDGICQLCGMKPAQHAHHYALPDAYPDGDDITADDLTALCVSCHSYAGRIRSELKIA